MPLFGRKKKPAAASTRQPEPPQFPGHSEKLRSLEEHRDFLLGQVQPLRPFGLSLLDAWNLTLCEDIVSYVDLPGFDNSAMDGYAVAAASVAGASEKSPVQLAVVGEVAAGRAADLPLTPGTAMKIMTGAPIPEGADAVVPYESTDRGSMEVTIVAPVNAGQHVRRKGSDVTEGTSLLSRGERVTDRVVGLLAAVGIDKVLVRPRPRVVVLSTGSELVEPGLELTRPGQIYNSNSAMLAAAARSLGAQVFDIGAVKDDPETLQQAVTDQLIRADLIVSSGGVSEGDYDVVKAAMPQIGVTDFAKVAMQPGKPQGFGLMGDDRVPMIMVPGNPVSAYVSFQAFVRPVLRKLMDVEPYVTEPVPAVARNVIHSRLGVTQLARGLVVDEGGRRMAETVGGHGSHLIGSLAKANALMLLPPSVETVKAGERVDVWLLDEG